MSGQWQQYPPDQHGYGYQGFQGQYAPQQHPQQQYEPPQQYGAPQGSYQYGPSQQDPAYQAQGHYGQYPQGYQQPPQPPTQQHPRPSGHIARPSPNTCYNCGSPDHWAMSCPEPRRAAPHGQMVDGARHKRKFPSRPPVIIKYDVPGPMGQQQPMPPQGWGGQGAPQGGYQQYPAPHQQAPQGQMPGPMPPHGQHQPYPQQYPGPDPQGQWQGHDQHPQWQGQYPQGQYPGPHQEEQYQGTRYSGQWHSQHHGQHHGQQHGQQQAYSQGPEYSQPPSVSSAHYQDPQQFAPQPSYPTPSSQPTSAVSAAPPSDAGAKRSGALHAAPSSRRGSVPASQGAGSVDMARSQSHQSMNDSISMESESDDEDASAPDDLAKLDVPDLPAPGGPDSEARPPFLVAQPLPALLDSDQRDALQPPPADGGGHVQSRYINAGNLEYTLKNARNKYDFKENQDDPAFRAIRDPTPPPVAAPPRREYRDNGYHRGNDRHEQYQRRSRSPVGARHISYRHHNNYGAPPPLPAQQPAYQHAYAAPHHQHNQHHHPQQQPHAAYSEPDEPPRSATPVYKPDHGSKRRPRNFDPFEPDSEDVPPPAAPAVEEPYTEWGRYDLNGPAPPALGNSARATKNGNPFAASPTNGSAQSPTKAAAAGALPDARKRRLAADAADEDDGRARRQKDGSTPKHKRNAPKVADAYSRRW